MQLIVLSGEDVRRCVGMGEAVDLMATAFSALSRGAADVPVRTSVHPEDGVTLVMPAWLPGEDGEGGTVTTKVVSVFPGNPDRGLPSVQAAVLVTDPETGSPLALLEGTGLTALRTGAATGLATRLLAREDARVLALFGAGAQARDQIAAVRAVRPVEEVRIVSRGGRSARRLAEELERESTGGPGAVRARAVDDPGEALRGADLVVAATDSATPVFPGDAVETGAHVNGIGAYEPGMREVDADLVARARVVVDSLEAAREEAGDLIGAVEDGVVGWDHVAAELGEVADGTRPGRTSPSEITFFKSVGSAVQDAAVAGRVLAEARRRGLGRTVEL